jgi:hypothetical protein
LNRKRPSLRHQDREGRRARREESRLAPLGARIPGRVLPANRVPTALGSATKAKNEVGNREGGEKRARGDISPISGGTGPVRQGRSRNPTRERGAKARRNELRSAQKRKADAVEEAKIRLAEKDARERREQFERKRRRTEAPQSEIKCNSVALSVTPFVTQPNTPILAGNLLHLLKAAIASGQFAIPGTASDPVTSEVLSLQFPISLVLDIRYTDIRYLYFQIYHYSVS